MNPQIRFQSQPEYGRDLKSPNHMPIMTSYRTRDTSKLNKEIGVELLRAYIFISLEYPAFY